MCYQKESNNINCPVCTPFIGDLAAKLPFSSRDASSMVCFISGQIMDENNPPMALPNGYIYSTDSLTKMAEAHQGQVICPKTGAVYAFSDLKKVFIM